MGYSRAVGGGNFYTDQRIRSEWGKFLYYIMNRENQRTCVKYKDDPAILAWETGNELHNPQEWAEYTAQLIKCLDPHHLVMDGNYGIRDESLEESSALDIVSNHYYGGHLDAGAVLEDSRKARGRKPFIIGEFGTNEGGDLDRVRSFVEAVVNSGTTGALLWTIRPHKRDGGFSRHCDAPSDLSCSFHWPGFPQGAHSLRFQHPNEKEIIRLIVDAASAIRGFPPGIDGRSGIPDSPKMLSVRQYPFHDLAPYPIFELRWRGSAGADAYVVERSPTRDGPWQQLTADASDNQAADPARSMYNDVSFVGNDPQVGRSYFYRVKAEFIDVLGRRVSAPSEPFASPVASCLGPWSDEELCEAASCGESKLDLCGVLHVCPACPPPPPCGGRPQCPDRSCPPCRRCPIGMVLCTDGSCAERRGLCPRDLRVPPASR